jgi:hypothetical protein
VSAVAIATLIEALLPSLLGLYSEIEQQYAGQVKPLADILAEANANWDAIAAQAAAQAQPIPTIVPVS